MVLAAFALAYALSPAQAPPAPEGWRRVAGAGGTFVYTPGDLRAGEVCEIALSPTESLGGASPEAWLAGIIGREPGLVGRPDPAKVRSMVSPERTLTLGQAILGRTVALYVAGSRDGRGRRLRVLLSMGVKPERYLEAVKALTAALVPEPPGEASGAETPGSKTPVARTPASRTPAGATGGAYPYVVPVGQGVPASKVEAIVHDQTFHQNGMDMWSIDRVFVLLKDGSVHEGFRTPLDSWDVAASRRGEPKTWGRWKKAGAGYVASWGGGAYEQLPGGATIAMPTGSRLDGVWSRGESRSSGIAVSSYRLAKVRFTKDGRFAKEMRSGAGTTAPYASATGTSVTRTSAGSGAGTYRIEGYLIVLRYDDGAVARVPFFRDRHTDEDLIWFEDATLYKN